MKTCMNRVIASLKKWDKSKFDVRTEFLLKGALKVFSVW